RPRLYPLETAAAAGSTHPTEAAPGALHCGHRPSGGRRHGALSQRWPLAPAFKQLAAPHGPLRAAVLLAAGRWRPAVRGRRLAAPALLAQRGLHGRGEVHALPGHDLRPALVLPPRHQLNRKGGLTPFSTW